VIRRLDHVAIAVFSTEDALVYFSEHLGLEVVRSEVIEELEVRLTYLSTGNAFLQLVESLSENTPVAEHLRQHGEGFHHVCFGCDDPMTDATRLGEGTAKAGRGRARVSAFIPGPIHHGARLECTEFHQAQDVTQTPGALGLASLS
jgi:methylmalonyl-CoA epimerase